MTNEILEIFGQIPGFYSYFIAFTLIFARLLAFFQIAPIFRRKEVVLMAKIGFSMMLSFMLIGLIDIKKIPDDVPYIYLLVVNVTEGFFIGLIFRMIFSAIQAAGDMANNQMALSSATIFDPSSRVQTSIVGQIFEMFAVIVFIDIGGLHWVISAFQRSFEIFPLYEPVAAFTTAVTLDYWILISGNLIFIGFQMVAPVVITTLAVDIILGIISKTAPQINVFQLSFVFKPTIGCMVILVTLPLFYRVLEDYFLTNMQHIF